MGWTLVGLCLIALSALVICEIKGKRNETLQLVRHCPHLFELHDSVNQLTFYTHLMVFTGVRILAVVSVV